MDESVSEQALLGVVDVELTDGRHIDLRPWGIKSGKRMLRQIVAMLTIGSAVQVEDGESRIPVIMERYADDLIKMIAETLKVSVAELEDEDKYTFGDMIGLMNGIITVNFLSRPGRRLVKNLEALFETLEKISSVTEEGAPASETTETETETPTP